MITKAEKKKMLKDHEFMLLRSKAQAYSKLSLERPLTDKELDEYRKIVKKLQEVV